MTQGRTRRVQDKLVLAREFTRALARHESTLKPAVAYRRLESWSKIKISDISDDNQVIFPHLVEQYSIPKRQYFYTWWKQDLEIAREQTFQEWVKPYTPATMHNNPFWNNPLSPYPLVESNKELLLESYNQLSRYWFLPLGFKKPAMTVAHAVWICIVVNTQPKLKYNLVDAWLLAEYFSAIHLNKMQDKDNEVVTPTSAPTAAIEDDALFYLESSPWNSTEEYDKYIEMTDKGLYKIPRYAWDIQQFFNKPQESDSNYALWQLQYPMLYGSQIRNMPWNPPYFKTLRYLAASCLEMLLVFNENDMIKDRQDKNNETYDEMHRVCTVIVRTMEERNPKRTGKIQLRDNVIATENTAFELSIIDRHYRLVLNLWQLAENDMHMPQKHHQLKSSPIVDDYLKESVIKRPKSP